LSNHTESQVAALERSRSLERAVAARPADFRILTGDRPTGPLHIGHYFGTLAKRVQLQDLGVELMVLIADYQVLTDSEPSKRLHGRVRGLIADYLAVGIDPVRSPIFVHSAVPELNELMLAFLSLVSDAELHRNPTVKAETEATGRGPNALMLTYPVHQAADILFCRANLVPVGLDQLPHVEMARLIARRFNERYAPVFPEPDVLFTETPLLLGVDGHKMSKSRGNGIALAHTEDETADLIRRATTDSERLITYEPERRPQVANLVNLLATVTCTTPHEAAEEIGLGGAGLLKARLTEALNELLRPMRERRRAAVADPAELDHHLRVGNERARSLATVTLDRVHDALGMTYSSAHAQAPSFSTTSDTDRYESDSSH
jgi:tryptophanyl-tRNA synthetase